MTWNWGSVHAPKRGCEAASYEDAFAIGVPAGPNGGRFRLAVSDGATESAFAQLWASMLVEAYVQSPRWRSELTSLARAWADNVWSRDLAWNVQERASGGAHAALVGAVVTPINTIEWRVHVELYGDSCFFITASDGTIDRAEPYRVPEDFDRRPYLLSTVPEHRARAMERRLVRRGTLQLDETLMLCTDAVGRWLLDAPPDAVAGLVRIALGFDQTSFAQWLEYERSAGRLMDDDSTVVAVTRR
jgi:hypothetical protein